MCERERKKERLRQKEANEGEGETHRERDRKREGKNMDWRAYVTESKHQRSVIIEGQTILQRRFILAEKRNEIKEIIHDV